MQALSTLLRSKVGIAVVGIILLGGLGGYIGVSSGAHPGTTTNSGNNSGVANTGAATNTADSATATTTSGATGGNPTPTDTPVVIPTNTTGTTNTGTGTGQNVDLTGTIGRINSTDNSFILQVNGKSIEVEVSGQTSYPGDSKSFQGLQTGWLAEVQGQQQADGTVTAWSVDTHSGA